MTESVLDYMTRLGRAAREASRVIGRASTAQKNRALQAAMQPGPGDGISQAGELSGLDALGITRLGLNGSATGPQAGQTLNNNRVALSTTFTRNGVNRTVGAIDLEANAFFSEIPPQVVDEAGQPVVVTQAASALPQMNGSGMVRNLRAAMSLSGTQADELEVAVAAFAALSWAAVALLRRAVPQAGLGDPGVVETAGRLGLVSSREDGAGEGGVNRQREGVHGNVRWSAHEVMSGLKRPVSRPGKRPNTAWRDRRGAPGARVFPVNSAVSPGFCPWMEY